MSDTNVIAAHRQAVRYEKMAADYCEMAEQSWSGDTLDAHDLTLIAVGAMGLAVQAANAATDDPGSLPNVARSTISIARAALARVGALLEPRSDDDRLAPLLRRVAGYRLTLELAAQELEQSGQAH